MFTQKVKYALKALGYLAKYHQKGPILMSEIAREKQIPLRFLENIFLELKKNDYLVSYRGRSGGYALATTPEKITIAPIIRIINGPIAMLPCASKNFYQKCEDCDESICGLNKIVIESRDALLSVLEHRTLIDLIDQDYSEIE